MIHYRKRNALYTYCGKLPARGLKTTTRPGRVTCPQCKRALAWLEERRRRRGRR